MLSLKVNYGNKINEIKRGRDLWISLRLVILGQKREGNLVKREG